MSSEKKPNAQPKSCTGCFMSLLSSSPWWVSSWVQPFLLHLLLQAPAAGQTVPAPLPSSGIPGRDGMLAIIGLDQSPEVLASSFPQVSPPLPFPCPALSSYGLCLCFRLGGRVPLSQEEGLSRPVQFAQLVWDLGLCSLFCTGESNPREGEGRVVGLRCAIAYFPGFMSRGERAGQFSWMLFSEAEWV